jgi:hypothetical protein
VQPSLRYRAGGPRGNRATVKAGRLPKVRSGFKYRIEICYEAALVGGLDGLDLGAKEVLEARLFSLSDLPAGICTGDGAAASGPARPLECPRRGGPTPGPPGAARAA